MDYKIAHIWDDSINNVHHITVEYNGYSYSVIFGRYINGGFLAYLIGVLEVNWDSYVIHFGMRSLCVEY